MTSDRMKKTIDWILSTSIGPATLTFFGGEPVLALDTIEEALPYICEKAALLDKKVYFLHVY